jgi:hypothetical protein
LIQSVEIKLSGIDLRIPEWSFLFVKNESRWTYRRFFEIVVGAAAALIRWRMGGESVDSSVLSSWQLTGGCLNDFQDRHSIALTQRDPGIYDRMQTVITSK